MRGEDGGDQVEVDVSGKPGQALGRKVPVPGDDLVLTIDKDLQTAAEKAVDDRLAMIGAHAAAAVVMNPQTGEILAMVSRPAFDPNLFAHGISSKDWNQLNNNPYHPMDNKTITGEYPPGSTFKIVTGTAALTEGVVTPDEQIFDSGHHWIIPKGNADGEALGWLNFRSALAHSDNVYFYEMGNRLGIDRLEKYARMFGLGQRTGIDLPYEAKGLVANRRYKEKNFDDGEWYLSETFDAAIGQGFNLVTPLQAAMVMGEIAADGKRYKPHVVNRIIAPDGSVVKDFQPELLLSARRSGRGYQARPGRPARCHEVRHGSFELPWLHGRHRRQDGYGRELTGTRSRLVRRLRPVRQSECRRGRHRRERRLRFPIGRADRAQDPRGSLWPQPADRRPIRGKSDEAIVDIRMKGRKIERRIGSHYA